MRMRTSWQGWMAAWLCAASVLSAGVAQAQAPGASPPDARAMLLRMAGFLGATQRLSVTVRGGYDAVQASGQKVEWNEVRTLTVSRPDRLRMDAERSDGARNVIVFDGKMITAYDVSGRVYAQAPQPGGVDESVVYLVRDLGVRLPLAALFLSRAETELASRVRSAEYVEKTSIFGPPAHHIVGRTDTVNFQVWITDGAQPVPQRIVMTYPAAAGQPQFWAQFSSWNLAPEVAESSFAFAAPAGASRIPFATALPQYAFGSRPASAKKGAKP